MLNWLKHAFAIESPDALVISGTQEKTVQRVCREINRRRMTLPVHMLLESSMPVHFLAGQLLRFVEPFLATLLDPHEIRDFASFLEQRSAVEYICRQLEEIEKTEKNPVPNDGIDAHLAKETVGQEGCR